MGVQGLWELLAPVGRRVSVEALGGKKLAIDASIWIVQFMKAMRDDKGDMIRNAHLLGFFRRICKLLYLRAKPVFVFDGGTPALKRRTVIARRRQRERAQSKIRKTAEKLLLNHLRTRKLEEIAQSIGLSQPEKKQQKEENSKRKRQEESNGYTKDHGDDNDVQQPPLVSQKPAMTHDNDMWTTSLISEVDEKDEEFNTSDDGRPVVGSDESDDENEEYFMLPPTQGRVDPAVLASLPPSMQLNLLVQMREQLVTDNRKKFQKVAKNPSSFSQLQIQAYLKTVAFRRDINEVQKAAAGKGIGGIPSARIASEADREYIFSTTFQREKQTNGDEREGTANASEYDQDDPSASRRNQLQGKFPIKREIDKGDIVSEGVDLQKLCPDNVLDEDGGSEDKDIEWEDEDDVVVSMENQPIKGASITIEIDQSDLLSEGIDLQKLCPDTEHGGSEDKDIEWEDGIAAMDCKGGGIQWVDGNAAPLTGGGDSEVEWEDGSGSLTSKGVDVCMGSDEMVGNTIMEIEAAELEEAIRRSLEDSGAGRVPKLVIREEAVTESKQNEVPLTNVAATTAPESEEAFLARERERKGKAIVDDYQVACTENRERGEGGTPVEPRQVFPLDSLNSASCKQLVSEENKAVLTEAHVFSVSEQALQACVNHQTTNFVPPKDSTEKKVDARMCQVESGESLNERKPNTQHSTPCSSHLNLEQVLGGQEKTSVEEKSQNDGNLHANLDNNEGPDSGSDTVPERKQRSDLQPPRIGSYSSTDFFENGHLQEALLKEAEEHDLHKDREAFAKRERGFLTEREELSRQQAELQDEMEAEQAAIQTDLQDERDLLLQEEMELLATQRKNQRNAESVTGEMFSECQELLQMFGLPFIIAPMEAEAQCAFMDSIGLVDGVVTEDCDVFLFGGRNVFKNIFDDRKYVETYYMKDVESELGLDQEKLIHMALLLGSDYTEGISGIGIVNAIEVVNTFQGEAGLQKFKEWLDAPDLTLLNKVHQDGTKKQARKKKTERESEAQDHSTNVVVDPDDAASERSETSNYNHRQEGFIDKHRAVSKNWNVPESFPNPMVINAYVSPQVDNSTESFSWGRPDLEALRRLCFERFGWNKSKSDELLLPVLKEYDRHETQLRLEAFYTFNQRFAKIRSKRIQKAVKHITGNISSELVDFLEADDDASPQTTTKPSKVKSKNDLSKKALGETALPVEASSEGTAGLKRRISKDASQMKVVAPDAAKQGRGRGGGRGRGRTSTSRGRGKALGKSNFRGSVEASLIYETSSEEASELEDGRTMGGIQYAEPRRSTRLPERAVYVFSGSEDESDTSLPKGGKSKAEGSPGHARSMLSQEVEDPGRSAIPSTNGSVEADINIDGTNRGDASLATDSATKGQFGLQRLQEEANYLVMGGGFCTADDENDEGPVRGPSRSTEGETTGSNNDANILPKEDSLSCTGIEGSSSLRVTPSINVTTGHSGEGVESALRAVPFLRRKKHRAN